MKPNRVEKSITSNDNLINKTLEETLSECFRLRLFVFVGVTLSATTAILGALLIPLFYNHVQYVQSILQSEVEFCKLRSTNIWREVSKTEVWVVVAKSTRDKRQAANLCCGCGTSPPGPPGIPGPDGVPGSDGEPGRSSVHGSDTYATNHPVNPNWCFECQPGNPGAIGNPGPKGLSGSIGQPGKSGDSAAKGLPGPPGVAGPPGNPGVPGLSGVVGSPGKLNEASTMPGPPGKPGPMGTTGLDGQKGVPGKPGIDGNPGEQGDKGKTGKAGKPGKSGRPGTVGLPGRTGSCDHCPSPRTAPGY